MSRWWGGSGVPGSGYSSGPTRNRPMTWQEAVDTFASGGWSRTRGEPIKVLPGAKTRLIRVPDGFAVEYRDTEVVRIHPDGTYTLSHGGYPTRMTAQRMMEYAPVDVSTIGERKSEISSEGYSFHMYDNLELKFRASAEEADRNLLTQFYPKESPRWSTLEFLGSPLRVDGHGRPVVADLLGSIAPPSWGTELLGRLQAWTPTGAPAHVHAPRGLEVAMREEWPDPLVLIPMQVRRTWFRNKPVALLWREVHHGSPDRYRWLVHGVPGRDPVTYRLELERRAGVSNDLEQAIEDAEEAISELGWSTAPPTLRQLLGYLAKGPPFGPVPSGSYLQRQRQLELPVQHPLLEAPVLRVHWMEPWKTWEEGDVPEGEWRPVQHPIQRQPLPGSLPWPGPAPAEGEVRQWFELPDGHAVAVVYVPPVYYARSWRERKPGRHEVLIHAPGH